MPSFAEGKKRGGFRFWTVRHLICFNVLLLLFVIKIQALKERIKISMGISVCLHNKKDPVSVITLGAGEGFLSTKLALTVCILVALIINVMI